MNIYGHLNKVNEIFLDLISERTNFVPEVILNKLKSSWGYIEKYIKNAHPDWTNSWSQRLEILDSTEMVISEDMIKDTYRLVLKIVEERSVRDYFNLYISIISALTIYSKSYEESCDSCQGELQYFTDMNTKILYKECQTCGFLYDGRSGNKVGLIKDLTLRPSQKSELVSAQIVKED